MAKEEIIVPKELEPLAGIETPYDHVLKSDKDFEYKLNHLDEAKLKEI